MSNWKEALRTWIYAHHSSVADFARTINVPRETVQSWVNTRRPNIPVPKYRKMIVNMTGVKIPKSQKKPSKTKVKAPAEPRTTESQIINLAGLIRTTSAMTIDFLFDSNQKERTALRKVLGDDLENFLEASRGLYSERSLIQVVGERSRRNEKKETSKCAKATPSADQSKQ